MCGRFVQISDPERIKVSIPELEITAGVREKFRQRFNIAPSSPGSRGFATFPETGIVLMRINVGEDTLFAPR